MTLFVFTLVKQPFRTGGNGTSLEWKARSAEWCNKWCSLLAWKLPSPCTDTAVHISRLRTRHGNRYPTNRLLQEKTKKHFVGIQEIPSPHITVYQRQYSDGTKNYCSVEIKTESTLQRRTTQHSSGIGNHATGRQCQGIDTIGRLNSFHRLPFTGVIGDIALQSTGNLSAFKEPTK